MTNSICKDAKKPTARQHSQTVRINGARVRLVTKDGKVTTKPVGEEEWVIQSEIVRQLRAMPEFASNAEDVRHGMFTLAGDFNAARRGAREAAKAVATGLTKGEHDIRVYLHGGRLGLIEVKGEETPLKKEQRERHALLAALGFERQAVVRSCCPQEAAAATVALVRGWLVANDADYDKAHGQARHY